MKTTNTTQNTQSTQNTQDTQNGYEAETRRLHSIVACFSYGISAVTSSLSLLTVVLCYFYTYETAFRVMVGVVIGMGILTTIVMWIVQWNCTKRLNALDQASADTDASPANEAEEVLS